MKGITVLDGGETSPLLDLPSEQLPEPGSFWPFSGFQPMPQDVFGLQTCFVGSHGVLGFGKFHKKSQISSFF